MSPKGQTEKSRSELLHGTLELLVLSILQAGPMNGYGVGRRIEELTSDALSVDEGSLYPALHRMESRGLIQGSWGLTENNRRAKFYRVTRSGKRRLAAERSRWSEFQRAVQKIVESI